MNLSGGRSVIQAERRIADDPVMQEKGEGW